VPRRPAISFDFDTTIDRRGTGSLKWDKYKDRDILPLWVADMDFRASPAVLRALHERVEHGVFGYTLPPAELIEALRSYLQTWHGWTIEKEWITWLPGVVPAMAAACRAIGEDGDDVMTAVPIYPHFLTVHKAARRNLITVPLQMRDNRWTFDFDRLESAITPRTRLFLLCNPHNPVGRSYTRLELATLAEICRRHDIILCSDEIHAGLVLDEDTPHVPTAMLSPDIADRTITLRAPSKTFNLPGLGCSYAIICDPALRRRFRRCTAEVIPFVNVMGFAAALAAYRDSRDWHMALLDYLRANRDRVEQAIREIPGLSMTHIEATYLAWIDTRPAGLQDPVKFFEDVGVGLSDGTEFAARGFVRLNFGCPRALLDEALARMAQALASRHRGSGGIS
jgi:cysteine-S-conjugate beta-lyase